MSTKIKFNKRKIEHNIYSKIIIILLLAIIAVAVYFSKNLYDYFERQYLLMNHPIQYESYVRKYAAENEIDEFLVYSVIKTESSFNPNAVSNMNARGLMQLMEESYDWIKYRLSDEETESFDDMFDEKTNIRYGSYLIGYLMRLFEDETCAIAAYHAGAGNVGAWLENEKYSSNGKTLLRIPTADTAHYVDKIQTAYKNYINLYGEKANG